MVVVLAAAGFAVLRVRGVFGSHQLPTYAGSMSDDANKSDPKRVVYEVFGPPGATADINYIDDDGETNQVNDAVAAVVARDRHHGAVDDGQHRRTGGQRLHRMPHHLRR